ncbi:hypothetical protein [Massilia sp. erpn]|uniref:hypothetical protein n=1 Tax=Massilia sp. erpn TaxID=2738142 RepID=UPI002103FB10|nr:hypothetical protein [Massilia sp. erpn]UTY56743.1 hypothetical protein HPQ68_05815 [Massilia sp. erpn]
MSVAVSLLRTTQAVLLAAPLFAAAQSIPFPESEIAYPGASATQAFVAHRPYKILAGGVMTEVNLLETATRSFDFSGNVPFVDPLTGASGPKLLQTSDPVTKKVVEFYGPNLLNQGAPGRLEKINGELITRSAVGDGLVGTAVRSHVISYALPPRTHVRWEMELAFGRDNGIDNWVHPENDPVVFWQLKSTLNGTPSLSASVEADPAFPGKLRLAFFRRQAGVTNATLYGLVQNIDPHTFYTLSIDAFLDERAAADGGHGRVRVNFNNNAQIFDVSGVHTLWAGNGEHIAHFGVYAFNNNSSNSSSATRTRTIFWRTARALVFPKPQ